MPPLSATDASDIIAHVTLFSWLFCKVPTLVHTCWKSPSLNLLVFIIQSWSEVYHEVTITLRNEKQTKLCPLHKTQGQKCITLISRIRLIYDTQISSVTTFGKHLTKIKNICFGGQLLSICQLSFHEL